MTMATRFSSVTMIANPVSGNGKTAGRIAEIRDRLRWTLLREVELVTTRFPGDALQSVRALRRGPGSALLIVLGGDGTVQEVANGLMHLPDSDRSRITLGLISSGTGQGLAQSIGLAEDVGTQIQQFPFLHTRPFDLGHVFLSGSDDTVRDRYFVNECQAGIGGEVVRRVEHSGRKALGGRLTFGLTALRVAMYHPNQVVRLSLDHGQAEVVNVTGLFVGNGQFTGGGMNLAPGALPWDGRLDLLIMKK
jgi:diacylglycerol kinase family enzyme